MSKYLIILSCVFAFVLCGCSGEEEYDLIDTLANEKQAIHDYLNQYATGEVLAIPFYSRKGLLIDSIFIFNHNSTGEVAKDSGWVVMDFDMYDLNGKILDTTDPGKWSTDFTTGYAHGGPVLFRVDTARYNILGEAFRHIGVGESGGEVIIPSVLGAVDGKTLHYKLTSYTIFEDVAEHEKMIIQDYLTQYAKETVFQDYPGEVESADTITYTLLLEKGEGTRNLQQGDSVLMDLQYGIIDDMGMTRRLRPIREPDSTKILFNERWQRDLPVGLIKGLERLQQGDSAHIIIPYGMGFGAAGRSTTIAGTKRYYEPPFSTLWCWVRIKEIVPQNEEE